MHLFLLEPRFWNIMRCLLILDHFCAPVMCMYAWNGEGIIKHVWSELAICNVNSLCDL